MPSHTHQFTGAQAGPHVLILGGIHGNEPVGVQAVEQLIKDLEKQEITGTITLAIGNPQALEQDVRFVETDLNRLFGEEIEELKNKPESNLLLEEKRALELEPLLKEADYLLDLHSTNKASVPFIYTKDTPKHLEIASLFGVEYIVSMQPELKSEMGGRCADNCVDRHGGVGTTYESGWNKDANSTETVYNNTKKYLSHLGVCFTDQQHDLSTDTAMRLSIFDIITATTDSFLFEKDWSNFDTVSAGQSIAQDGEKPVVVDQDSFIIFPKVSIQAGSVACYLATEAS